MTVTDGGRRLLQAGIEGDFALLLNPKETTMKKLALVAAATVLGMATTFSAAARPGDECHLTAEIERAWHCCGHCLTSLRI